MSQEKILDALEFIDDDMIEAVDVLRKHPERHRFLWLNYVAVAACVVLAIFGGFTLLNNKINAPVAENSASNENADIQNDNISDALFGDAEQKQEYAENNTATQNTVDDNSSFRDGVVGSTGATSNGSTGSSTNTSFTYSPVYMEITEISENSFKGRVINCVTVDGTTHFEKNQVVTVIYRESEYADYDTLLIENLKVGEKVYVIYGAPISDTIYTPYIRYDRNF